MLDLTSPTGEGFEPYETVGPHRRKPEVGFQATREFLPDLPAVSGCVCLVGLREASSIV